MNNIDKIRQEIERLKEEYDEQVSARLISESLVSMREVEALNKVLAFIDSLPEEKLSLPSNLAEAAEESMPEEEWFLEIDIYGGSEAVYSREQMLAMFRAGAEWMAEQGLISEGIIYQTSGKDTTIELNEHIGYLEDCDEVIVNIKKK